VMLPLTNFALHDRAAGTTALTSALAAWRKLEKIERNPRVAMAFHTRSHATTGHDRPEYVLVQGTASFSKTADRAWLESIEDKWVEKAGPRQRGPVMGRWTRIYHWERVPIEIDIERITVWPDLRCSGEPEVFGADLPDAPPPQKPPKNGTAPRVAHDKIARKAASLDDTLLGWVGGDGFPVIAPVSVDPEVNDAGIVLGAPSGVVPSGGRRAGLTAHSFTEYVMGQDQRVHTGWLEAGDDGTLVYAPHTKAGYRMPASRLLYPLIVGAFTRVRQREARKAGFLDPAQS
jgi:hypothetical protein